MKIAPTWRVVSISSIFLAIGLAKGGDLHPKPEGRYFSCEESTIFFAMATAQISSRSVILYCKLFKSQQYITILPLITSTYVSGQDTRTRSGCFKMTAP